MVVSLNIVIPIYYPNSNSAPITTNSSSGGVSEETPDNSAQQKEPQNQNQNQNHSVEIEDIESILSHLHGT